MAKRGRKPKNPNRVVPDWSQRIERARLEASLDRRQLAAALGKSLTQVGYYETGEAEPDLATFEAIGRIVNADPGFLAYGKPSNPDAVVGAIVEENKDDRLFAWAFHETAMLISEEGLQGDLSFVVNYARKFMRAAKGCSDDVESKEVIRRAIDSERLKIRDRLDDFRKNLVQPD